MQNSLLIFCFFNVCCLHLLENIGFLFRIAGFEEDNLVSGYSFQTSYSFASRILTLFFTPVFAFLADSKSINIEYRDIIFYFIILFLFIFFCIKRANRIIDLLRIIVSSQLSGMSVLGASFQKKVLLGFLKIIISIRLPTKLFKSYKIIIEDEEYEAKNIINIFSLTYFPFYSCWIIISLLITLYPERPSFMISLATFFTFLTTIYQSLFFDPWISRYAHNKEFSKAVYLQLQILKLRSVVISFILSSLVYLFTLF